MDIISNLLKLYAPLFLCVCTFFFAWFHKISTNKSREVTINFFGFVQFPIQVSNKFIIKMTLFCLSICFLSFYLFMDFSSLFPTKLEMQVFYSPEKIQESFKIYNEDELKSRKIIYKDFEKYQNEYYQNMDNRLMQIVNDTFQIGFFTKNKSDIHSEGHTTFIVEKINGINNYYIKESKGELKHILAEARSDKFEFLSNFEKDKSPNDYIYPSTWDLLFKHEIILMPCFKENITELYSSNNSKFDHRLFGLTKIYTFPYPKFSNTIYLFEKPNVGLIPIGYAVYKEN